MNGAVGLGGKKKPGVDQTTPSYFAEHLATFAVGKQYHLETNEDGIEKLKQMEKSSAIWAQPVVLRFLPESIIVEDENGELVESFPMGRVLDPTAYLSTDGRDAFYNNILVFTVRGDRFGSRILPTELHIFQSGQSAKVKPGRRDAGSHFSSSARSVRRTANARWSGRKMDFSPPFSCRRAAGDDQSGSSEEGVEQFERDVNTLNHCFDDIERFVARIQSSASAHRQLEAQRLREQRRRLARMSSVASPRDAGILGLRAQLPSELEFYDILQRFKLSFNLLAKLRSHIHEPNAPELLHFLFTPLTVILDASHWCLGRNVAPEVVSPLLSRETKELLQNCLTSKETDVWMSLGDAWRVSPEDWPGPLPRPFRPVFHDGFAPYGTPSLSTAPPTTVAAVAGELNQVSLEDRDRFFDCEKDRVRLKEVRLAEKERALEDERLRLEIEKRLFYEEQERRSVVSDRSNPHAFYRRNNLPFDSSARSSRSLQNLAGPQDNEAQLLKSTSPRQKAFSAELSARGAKLVLVTYDRTGQNAKELTVSRGEYLEVLDDTKNWWECRNVHGRVGYAPHTILSVVEEAAENLDGRPVNTFTTSADVHADASAEPKLSPVATTTPDYIKNRQGKRGEFRYF